MNDMYYRGSNLYLDAVQNQLKSIIEETGFPISSQDINSNAELKNRIQANTDALKKMEKGIQMGIAASSVAMYSMGQGIRSDIQANTDAIQNAANGIRSDIRESTYATLRMGKGLSNDIQNNTNAIQDMAIGLNSAIRENTYTLIASQRMLQETIIQGVNAFSNAMGIGFEITNKNLAEAVIKLDEIHNILNNPLLTQSRELYRRALDNYKRGLYEEALEDGLGAVEKNKTDFISWYLLGHIYLFGAGKFSNVIDVDKAEDAFQNAAKYIDYDLGKSEEANSLGSEIYYYLGYARLIKSNDLLVENKNDESVKKLEEAEKASSESYRLSEKNLVALYEQAKELHFLGRDDEALQIVEKLIRTEKNYAFRAANDKNFESIWDKIDALIIRLRDEIANNIISECNKIRAEWKARIESRQQQLVDITLPSENQIKQIEDFYYSEITAKSGDLLQAVCSDFNDLAKKQIDIYRVYKVIKNIKSGKEPLIHQLEKCSSIFDSKLHAFEGCQEKEYFNILEIQDDFSKNKSQIQSTISSEINTIISKHDEDLNLLNEHIKSIPVYLDTIKEWPKRQEELCSEHVNWITQKCTELNDKWKNQIARLHDKLSNFDETYHDFTICVMDELDTLSSRIDETIDYFDLSNCDYFTTLKKTKKLEDIILQEDSSYFAVTINSLEKILNKDVFR